MQNLVLTPIPLEEMEQRFSNLFDQKLQSLVSVITEQKHEQQPCEYLSRKEAAKLLGISLVTLNEWTKKGLLKGYRIASRVRYKRSEIETSLSAIKTNRRAA